MPSPETKEAFLTVVRQAKVVDEPALSAALEQMPTDEAETPRQLADRLVREGLLTSYQASLLLKGRTDGFRIGPYRVLERLGFGAMSNVYLCRHQATPGRVAVKVLATMQAKNSTALKRFYREARAASALDHPNLVRVRDIDWDGDTEYMVMDYVDGSSIQDIVKQFGQMDVTRAAHYIAQAAKGLQYAHERGLVHRDIKPGNLLIDRQGTVKILDMGLARFTEEDGAQLTQGGEVLGTPEYAAPEQAVDSHNVDIRADIYALGAVFYFMLTGTAPYSEEKSAAGKLLAKEKRPPRPIRESRPEAPEELVAVVDKMMARDRTQRYATPSEVVAALATWTQTPIDPPPEQEMPQLSLAARSDQAPAPRRTPVSKKQPVPAEDDESPEEEAPSNMGWLAQGVGVLVVAIVAFAAMWLLVKK
jgi:serine/threonine protein kinase